MNYKQNSNSFIIWSPNCTNKFIKVTSKQIELYESKTNHLDENLSVNTELKKLASYNDIEIIKTVSWQVTKTEESYSTTEDVIAIGLITGVLKFLNLIQVTGDSSEYNFTEREIRPKYLKPFLYISWNPWIKNMFAQVIDKTKGSSNNEPSILIYEFQKSGENKALTPTFNQSNVSTRFVQQQSVSNQTPTLPNKIPGDIYSDQASYEYCRGDVVNSFAWINQSQFICGINNKYLRIFEIRGQNPLKVVNTDATYCLCIDIIHQPNYISSFVDEKIVIWKEESLDKPILTYVEDNLVEYLEWSPISQGYLCVIFKERPYIKVLDTRIALINSNHEVEHALIDRYIKSTNDITITFATWHRQIENCILLLLADEKIEIVYLRIRRHCSWSVDQKFVSTIDRHMNICFNRREIMSNSDMSANNTEQISQMKLGKIADSSNESTGTNKAFLKIDVFNFFENDISLVMKQRALGGYGLKSQFKDYPYSAMFNDNSDLKTFWTWIENASHNRNFNSEGYGNKIRANPFSGAIDGINDVTSVITNKQTSEINFKLNEPVSRPEEVRWNHVDDILPFPKYVHPFRTKIFAACGWPFDQPIEKWRYILESLENKERSASMALVTLNFDVALQYLKRIPNEKGIDSEILRLCLAGFNTQSGQANNSMWSAICKDVLQRLGDSRPYLRLIFNFLIVKNKNELQFIKSLNILLTDKLAIAALYMDDECLIDFFNNITNTHLKNGYLEMVALTGLKSKEFIDLLQAYVRRTADLQTAAIAVLQANILTRNSIEKTKRSHLWVESYRSFLDNLRLWVIRAEFDIASQYVAFISNKDAKAVKPQTLATTKHNSVILNTAANQNQVYVACGFCGWKISQPSKYATNLNRNSIQNKTRPDGSFYGNSTISNIAMHAGGSKSTICQHCRKPLPRCSVCLMNMGINGDTFNTPHGIQGNFGLYSQKDDQLASNPIENWFVWCQKCKHGGHNGHLEQWFLEWNECPVSGCKCLCCDLDSSYSLFSGYDEKVEQNNVDLL